MNHQANLTATLAHIWDAMSCESTVAELAALVTRAQADMLLDAENWIREIRTARPRIQPAKDWRTPTEVRRAVAVKTGAGREFVGRRRR